MEWWLLLLIILIALIFLMFIQVPVAFAFILVNIVAAYFLWGGEQGLLLVIKSVKDSLTTFTLLPIPLFILMGEIIFQSGIAPKMINTLDKWLGKLPGRLSLLSIGGGAMLSTLTASAIGSTAMLGSTLIPEMEKKNYSKEFTIGPILASGGLAVMIPPSALGVLMASMSGISVGAFLIAIIVPGILMALLFSVYVIVRAKIQPHMAPAYDIEMISIRERLKLTAKYILPLSLIILFVIGSIFLGIASPTEAAALGVLGSIILAIGYNSFNKKVIVTSFIKSLNISVMILIIVSGSKVFSQVLSYSGATRGLVSIVGNLNFAPVIILLIMILIVLIMGSFMEPLSIMMVTIPIFIPIVEILEINLLWLAVLLLIAIEIGNISPPFGIGLFVMKGVAPKGTIMMDIYKASIPFVLLNLFLIVIIIVFPDLVTFLPDVMRE
ncbi:TRAP transporter large permease subunit [Oceanobacillus longus]|uniref:TRAP transporter large permease subunit n=1 Tax=Oceanobacillus longus TaxID=930120 RepID=A0ABV8H2U3_9BACI